MSYYKIVYAGNQKKNTNILCMYLQDIGLPSETTRYVTSFRV